MNPFQLSINCTRDQFLSFREVLFITLTVNFISCSQSYSTMGTVDVKKIEEDIHSIALTRRIRPSQFFVDYDRLRSGAVTGR